MHKNSYQRSDFSKKEVSKVKEAPGIYIFFSRASRIIYVGKSVNLKSRLRSYLTTPLEAKTQRLVSETTTFSTIQVNTEIEALLLEANLVKKHLPKYNIELKDDKNPLYIRITREIYPQVLLARRLDLKRKNISYYGPFPSSGNVRYVLKTLRKIIPYSQHKIGKRPCLYSQLGLCNPCPNIIESVEEEKQKMFLQKLYKKNISIIKKVLEGKLIKNISDLEKKMKLLSSIQKFEEAEEVKLQLQKFSYITQKIVNPNDFIKNPNLIYDIRRQEIDSLKTILKNNLKINNLQRIECFDVSHTAGANPTASMVTFIDGEPVKNLYRRFKISQIKTQNDLASLKEVAIRRSKHLVDWGIADLIIVDGGKTQVGIFLEVFEVGPKIPVIGIAKRFETLIIPVKSPELTFKEERLKPGPALNLVQRLRNEAHRFARLYHHKLFQTDLLKYK